VGFGDGFPFESIVFGDFKGLGVFVVFGVALVVGLVLNFHFLLVFRTKVLFVFEELLFSSFFVQFPLLLVVVPSFETHLNEKQLH